MAVQGHTRSSTFGKHRNAKRHVRLEHLLGWHSFFDSPCINCIHISHRFGDTLMQS